jgi:hypothetical protein
MPPSRAARDSYCYVGLGLQLKGVDLDHRIEVPVYQYGFAGCEKCCACAGQRLYEALRLRHRATLTRADAPYRSGRTETWLKVKCYEESDYEVAAVLRNLAGRRLGRCA